MGTASTVGSVTGSVKYLLPGLQDGLLTLHVPKNQASKAREIPIKAG